MYSIASFDAIFFALKNILSFLYNASVSDVSLSYVIKNKIMIFSTELIKGTLKTIVLKLLSDNKKMYGYEITQHVKELTKDRIQISEGALYPTLHALEVEGLLTTETEYIGKRVRKYYSLSPSGKTKTKEKINELTEFMETMKLLLDLKLKTA
jgi:DNA-binding PadR family transcriptional regulator